MRSFTLLSLLAAVIVALSSAGPATAASALYEDVAAPLPPSSRPALPLNLTVPYASAPSTWSIRLLDGTYYWLDNNTVSEVTVRPQRWSAAAVEASLRQQMGSESAWKRQQKQLAKHVKHANRQYAADQTGWMDTYNNTIEEAECKTTNHSTSCSLPVEPSKGHNDDKHEHDHHDRHHYNKGGNTMMKFYLRHAQCRACVQPNVELLQSTSVATAGPRGNSLPYLASYQPAAIMKWCTLTTPKLASEKSPLASHETLADWEGVCVPAEAQCPSATTDMNILSPTTCAADEPVTKQSCTLCVLDGYSWQTNVRAFDRADNYAGTCMSSASANVIRSSSSDSEHERNYRVMVTELDSCPSVVSSMQFARQYNIMFTSFAVFMALAGMFLCCSCLRACCRVRKARQLARLRLANGCLQSITVGTLPAVTVGTLPAVSLSATPSAPPAAGYPAAVAAAQQQYQEPLLSSGLNPPRMSVSSLYPQLQAQQVSVAQPYAYGRL